jgi:hypothetical protein
MRRHVARGFFERVFNVLADGGRRETQEAAQPVEQRDSLMDAS